MTPHSESQDRAPRVLLVSPVVTFLSSERGWNGTLTGRAAVRADLTVALAAALGEQGAEAHVALPHFRRMFDPDLARLVAGERVRAQRGPLSVRVHCAEDRAFYFRAEATEQEEHLDVRVALAFQREVIRTIVPRVRPDIVHCNDWMTGLIPAAMRELGIPCVFTFHNASTRQVTLAEIEAAGIDAHGFWQSLYYARMPAGYHETRATNPADLLASGIFAAGTVGAVSPTFLKEIAQGRHDFVPANVSAEVTRKKNEGCAVGILNAPDAGYDPAADPFIPRRYSPGTQAEAKPVNKVDLQQRLGLDADPNAPLFFWPYRLDTGHRGCDLLAQILPDIASAHREDGLQVAIVADGLYQKPLRDIVRLHGLERRVAMSDYAEDLWRQGYAASDFTLAPGLFEPCGRLAQIGLLYGSLPVARDTGALHDIVTHLDPAGGKGNGFRFETYDANGLRWAMGQAMAFYRLPSVARAAQITRVMQESAQAFAPAVTAGRHLDLYRALLARRAAGGA